MGESFELPQWPSELTRWIQAESFRGVIPVSVLRAATTRDAKELLLQQLVDRAQSFAQPSISGYHVGAAALGASGSVYLGANLEVAGGVVSDTVHAEQSATMLAWAHGETALRSIALSAAPCGQCRQFLAETADGGALRVLTPGAPVRQLRSLLPASFGSAHLSKSGALLRGERHALQLAPASSDFLVNAALLAAETSYAPYTGGYAGVALLVRDEVYLGRYAENAAFNPSVEPLNAALAVAAFARVRPADIARTVLVQADSRVDHAPHTRRVLDALGVGPLEAHVATAAPGAQLQAN